MWPPFNCWSFYKSKIDVCCKPSQSFHLLATQYLQFQSYHFAPTQQKYIMMRLIAIVVVVSSLGYFGDAVTPYQYTPSYGEQVATGALTLGGQYGQQTAASETHDKKNVALNFSSDKGSSNKLSNMNAQVAGAGSYGQGIYPQSQYSQYPVSNLNIQYPVSSLNTQYPRYPLPQTNVQYQQYPSVYPYSQNYPTVQSFQVPQAYPGGLGWANY